MRARIDCFANYDSHKNRIIIAMDLLPSDDNVIVQRVGEIRSF